MYGIEDVAELPSDMQTSFGENDHWLNFKFFRHMDSENKIDISSSSHRKIEIPGIALADEKWLEMGDYKALRRAEYLYKFVKKECPGNWETESPKHDEL